MFVIIQNAEICDGSSDVYPYGYSTERKIIGYSETKQDCIDWINKNLNGRSSSSEIQLVEDEDPDFLNAKGLRYVREQYEIKMIDHI